MEVIRCFAELRSPPVGYRCWSCCSCWCLRRRAAAATAAT